MKVFAFRFSGEGGCSVFVLHWAFGIGFQGGKCMGEMKGQGCVINQPLAPPLKLGATKMHWSPSCGQQGELARGPESRIPALSLSKLPPEDRDTAF